MAVPYTSATARTQVRSLLNEPTARRWTNTEIDNWIKEAAVDISTLTKCVEACYGLSLITATGEYTSSTAAASAPNSNETDVTFGAATPGTATSGALADWIADGFKHGMRVTISNTTSHNNNFTIRSVPTEDSMTFFEETTAEGPGNADLDVIYSWIDDIIDVYDCVYHNGDAVTGDLAYRGLRQIHPKDRGRMPMDADGANGEPHYWWWAQETLGISPIPSASQNKDCVLVYHSRVTEDIADLPDLYHSFAIWYAVAMARKKQGTPQGLSESEQFLAMYQNSLSFHRQDLHDKGVDAKGAPE